MKLPERPGPAGPAESELSERVLERLYQATANRAYYFTLLLAGLFGLFGFTSLEFIAKYRPEVTLWTNLAPRLAFNCLPLVGLALFIRRSRMAPLRRIQLWLAGLCLCFDAASMVHVWPIALSREPSILLYVNATNTSLFAVVTMMLALPPRAAVAAFLQICLLCWLPLGWVAYQGGDPTIFKTVLNDTGFLGVSAFFLGIAIFQERERLVRYEIGKESEASKFLGPLVSKAIFEQRSEMLGTVTRRGFVLSLDIRDSTELQKRFNERWRDFRRDYFALVSRTVETEGGYIQKTVGDAHVINFGVLDDEADLEDIPGIEIEIGEAEERRLSRVSESAFRCSARIFQNFQDLAAKHFPGEPLRLGGGIDKGPLERGVQGDAQRLEFDVNGDAVNCSNRLQEYSKLVSSLFGADSSLLVVSPYAADYLSDLGGLKRVSTAQAPIRNYPKIRWVLIREFQGAAGLKAVPPPAAEGGGRMAA